MCAIRFQIFMLIRMRICYRFFLFIQIHSTLLLILVPNSHSNLLKNGSFYRAKNSLKIYLNIYYLDASFSNNIGQNSLEDYAQLHKIYNPYIIWQQYLLYNFMLYFAVENLLPNNMETDCTKSVKF